MSGMKKCEESRDSSFFKKRVAVTDLTEDFIFTLNVSNLNVYLVGVDIR